jgi:hypothetical protein
MEEKNKKLDMKTNEIYDPFEAVKKIKGQFSLNNFNYNAVDIEIELEDINSNKKINIKFNEVFASRITLEHFRWKELKDTELDLLIYTVNNSKYIEWIKDSGMEQLYGNTLDIKHYCIFTIEHTIDVICKFEPILGNGNASEVLI